jgi:hypothetical protein
MANMICTLEQWSALLGGPGDYVSNLRTLSTIMYAAAPTTPPIQPPPKVSPRPRKIRVYHDPNNKFNLLASGLF